MPAAVGPPPALRGRRTRLVRVDRDRVEATHLPLLGVLGMFVFGIGLPAVLVFGVGPQLGLEPGLGAICGPLAIGLLGPWALGLAAMTLWTHTTPNLPLRVDDGHLHVGRATVPLGDLLRAEGGDVIVVHGENTSSTSPGLILLTRTGHLVWQIHDLDSALAAAAWIRTTMSEVSMDLVLTGVWDGRRETVANLQVRRHPGDTLDLQLQGDRLKVGDRALDLRQVVDVLSPHAGPGDSHVVVLQTASEQVVVLADSAHQADQIRTYLADHVLRLKQDAQHAEADLSRLQAVRGRDREG